MPKYIIKDLESYCDEYDKEGSDEENSKKKIQWRNFWWKKSNYDCTTLEKNILILAEAS